MKEMLESMYRFWNTDLIWVGMCFKGRENLTQCLNLCFVLRLELGILPNPMSQGTGNIQYKGEVTA